MKILTENNDPMGCAIRDYWTTGSADCLRVISPMLDEDELPVAHLFRPLESMPMLEREALDLARGRTLDVGAGAGCHSLELQRRGIDVTAIDLSGLAVEVMRERGVSHARCADFFDIDERYDTILMLMNGMGIVGTLNRLPAFFARLDHMLAPGGRVLCDSSDIIYLFEDEDGRVELPQSGRYYGEVTYSMQYKEVRGRAFPWLYVDARTLALTASACGYRATIVKKGEHYDFLVRIEKNVH